MTKRDVQQSTSSCKMQAVCTVVKTQHQTHVTNSAEDITIRFLDLTLTSYSSLNP